MLVRFVIILAEDSQQEHVLEAEMQVCGVFLMLPVLVSVGYSKLEPGLDRLLPCPSCRNSVMKSSALTAA